MRLGDSDGRAVGFAEPDRADARLANATHLSAANATASAPSVKSARAKRSLSLSPFRGDDDPPLFDLSVPLSTGSAPSRSDARQYARCGSSTGASASRCHSA